MFGRRGGHWVPGDGTGPPKPLSCRVCGHVVHVHGADPGVHLACLAGPPPSLFDDGAI